MTQNAEKFIFKQSDVLRETKKKRPQLYYARYGQTVKCGDKEYTYPPLLVEGEDWSYDRGRPVFAKSAIIKILNKKKDGTNV